MKEEHLIPRLEEMGPKLDLEKELVQDDFLGSSPLLFEDLTVDSIPVKVEVRRLDNLQMKG